VRPAEYHFRFLLLGVLVFLLHGAKLNSDIIGIDTEDIIHLRDGFYGGWLQTGRQGLVFLKCLTGNLQFNPYFSGLMTLLLFSASTGAFFLLWDRTGGLSTGGLSGGTKRRAFGRADLWAWALGGLLWISHPVMAEQFYFSLQSMEICVCLLATALALYLSSRWAEGHGPLQAAGSVLLLLLTFSGYQIFVVLYIFGTVSVVLLQALGEIRREGHRFTEASQDTGIVGMTGTASNRTAGRDLTAGSLMRNVVPYFTVFLAAFLLNTLITRLFFGSSGYLQNQIYWGQASVKDCIYAVGAHIVKVFTGQHSVFYQACFGLMALFDLGLLIVFLHKFCGERKGIRGVAVFFYLSLLAAPFLMTFLLGGAPAVRSQLVLPAAAGFLGYLGVWLCGGMAEGREDSEESENAEAGTGGSGRVRAEAGGQRRAEEETKVRGRDEMRCVVSVCFAVVCLVGGMEQAKVTERLYYTDRCRYEQDAALGRAVIQRVRQVNMGDDGVPLIVVGRKCFAGNNACVMGEVIGRSFFDYDTEVEPISFWSTRRVLGFLHSLGAEFSQAPEERIEEALEYSTYMPEWPAEDSVQEKDGMIIIKLSHYE